MDVTNALADYDNATITVVKSFIVQAQDNICASIVLMSHSERRLFRRCVNLLQNNKNVELRFQNLSKFLLLMHNACLSKCVHKMALTWMSSGQLVWHQSQAIIGWYSIQKTPFKLITFKKVVGVPCHKLAGMVQLADTRFHWDSAIFASFFINQ